MLAGVFVCFADDPGRGVGDAEVEDFSGRDDVVEGVHDFGDGGGVVPPVDVEEVDVARLEFLQGSFERDVQTLGMVPRVILLQFDRGPGRVWRGEFGREDNLVAVLPRFHPFAEPGFGLLHLVIVGRVDEVAAVLEEVVEHLEGGVLVAFAEEFGPGVAEVHGAEAEGGYADAGYGGEDAVGAEEAVGLGG